MDQPARCLSRGERRAPPAALRHRGPIGSRPRSEPVAPPRDPACRRSALLAAFGAQHDAVARWKSTQPTGGDQATLTSARRAAPPRLLDLVVPGSEDFFQRLPPENWPCTSRVMPLSMRIPVLAGVAEVSSRPEYWIDKLVGAAALQNQRELLRCAGALASSGGAELSLPIPFRFRILPQNPESSCQRFRC
jgi:hypothetical protein